MTTLVDEGRGTTVFGFYGSIHNQGHVGPRGVAGRSILDIQQVGSGELYFNMSDAPFVEGPFTTDFVGDNVRIYGTDHSQKLVVEDNDSNIIFNVDTILDEVNVNGTINTHLITAENVNSSTGVLIGGELRVNAGDNTKFDILEGSGICTTDYVINGTISESVHVEWGDLIGITPTYLLTDLISFISIDTNSNIVQSATRPTNAELRDNIYLGVLVHINLTNLDTTNPQPLVITHSTNIIHDLYQAIGFLNISGNVITNASNDLTIAKSVGEVMAYGSNFYIDTSNPNIKTIAAQSPQQFQIRLSDGVNQTGLTETSLDTSNYESVLGPPSVYSAIGNNKYCIMRFYLFTSGNIKVMPPQHEYNSLQLAIDEVFTEAFTVEPSILSNGIWVGVLIFKKGVTDLSDTSQAVFQSIGKFGNVSSASGTSTATLQSAYDNSPSNPEITTSLTGGKLTIRQGSGADSDFVLSTQNGAGTDTFKVNGTGNLTCTTLDANGDISCENVICQFIQSFSIVEGLSDITISAPILCDDITSTGTISANLFSGPLTGVASSATLAVNTSNVSTKTASQVVTSVDLTENADTTPTINTLCLRDGSGNSNFNVLGCTDISISGDILPVLDLDSELGSALKRYKTLYTTNIYDVGTLLSLYNVNINGGLGISGNIIPVLDITDELGSVLKRFKTLYTTNIYDTSTLLTLYNTHINGNILPVLDLDSELGSTLKRFKTLYTTNIYDTGTSLTLYNTNVNGNLTMIAGNVIGDLTGNADSATDADRCVVTVGSTAVGWVEQSVVDTRAATSADSLDTLVKRDLSGNIGCSQLTARDIRCQIANTYDIGTSGSKFQNLYVNHIHSTNITDNGTDIDLITDVYIPDNKSLYLGTGSDMRIYHSGADTFFRNTTGHMRFEVDAVSKSFYFDLFSTTTSNAFIIRDKSSNVLFRCYGTGATEIRGNLQPTINNSSKLGISGKRWNEIFCTNATINTSDENDKKDILDTDLGLEFVMDLKPKKYKWKNGKRDHYGLVAQDVKHALGTRDAGFYIDTKIEEPDEPQSYGLRYGEFTSVLIKAIQDQQKMIDDLTARIIQLET